MFWGFLYFPDTIFSEVLFKVKYSERLHSTFVKLYFISDLEEKAYNMIFKKWFSDNNKMILWKVETVKMTWYYYQKRYSIYKLYFLLGNDSVAFCFQALAIINSK